MASSYREQGAPAVLAGVVACLWRTETSRPRQQRVLPDGCMDLIWMNGSVHVAGPDTCAFLTTLNPRQVISGVRFRPGAAPAVLGVPAHVLRDQRVRLDELWPGTNLIERIAQAPHPASALAAAITSHATGSQHGLEPDHALSAVVAQLRAGSSVVSTANALGWTGTCVAPAMPRRLRLRPIRAAPHPTVPDGATIGRAGGALRYHGSSRGVRRPSAPGP